MNATQQEITKLRSLQESFDEMSSKIDQFVSAASPVQNLANELYTGKQNVVNALQYRGVQASTDETLTQLADKIANIEDYEAVVVPADTSNIVANNLHKNIFQLQGYDQIYETVRANYCGENGSYVGLLMTVLYKGTTTGITLTGADAYYIYDEDVFYKTDENYDLVLFVNGQEAPLSTKGHTWDVTNTSPMRIVFYLYSSDSQASCDRENAMPSYLDYCFNTTIPKIIYKSNGGVYMYYHVANPDTCDLSWGGSDNKRTRYFYTNVENQNYDWRLTNGDSAEMISCDISSLKHITQGTTISPGNILYNLNVPNLETVSAKSQANDVFVFNKFLNLRKLEFPKLKTITDCRLINNCPELTELTFDSLESVSNTRSTSYPTISNLNKITSLYFPKLQELKGPNNAGLIQLKNLQEITFDQDLQIYRGIRSESDLIVNCERIIADDYATNRYADINAPKIYFNTIKSGNINMGGSSSYSPLTKYIYLACLGSSQDVIELYTGFSTGIVDIELREGAKQSIYLTGSAGYNLTAENIVNHIFEKLADNTFEDDGVTPAAAIKITIGSTALKKLTDEQKAIVTNKNYILA